jgi:hypothetical protein
VARQGFSSILVRAIGTRGAVKQPFSHDAMGQSSLDAAMTKTTLCLNHVSQGQSICKVATP